MGSDKKGINQQFENNDIYAVSTSYQKSIYVYIKIF